MLSVQLLLKAPTRTAELLRRSPNERSVPNLRSNGWWRDVSSDEICAVADASPVVRNLSFTGMKSSPERFLNSSTGTTVSRFVVASGPCECAVLYFLIAFDDST